MKMLKRLWELFRVWFSGGKQKSLPPLRPPGWGMPINPLDAHIMCMEYLVQKVGDGVVSTYCFQRYTWSWVDPSFYEIPSGVLPNVVWVFSSRRVKL